MSFNPLVTSYPRSARMSPDFQCRLDTALGAAFLVVSAVGPIRSQKLASAPPISGPLSL
jgi:hypothetical protein